MRKSGAYLTVYLALTMAVLLSLCMALIEGTRYNAIRLEGACAAEVGLNSIFAEYHRELLEQYNLFAIDTSYGSTLPAIGSTQSHLSEYMRKNLMDDNVDLLGWLCRDFLDMELEECSITSAAYLTDDNGTVFHKRAVQAVQDDLGLELFDEVKSWIQTVESNELTERDVGEEKDELDQKLAKYSGKKVEISETETKTVTATNPTAAIEQKRAEGILKWVLDEETISGASVTTEDLISARIAEGNYNQGNLELTESSGTEELLENFFFHEYLLRYMEHYGDEADDDALNYQVEYILMGKSSDEENLKAVAELLFAVRWAADAVYLYSNEEKSSQAETLGSAIAALLMIPEASSVLKNILLLGWAFMESIYDVSTLFDGGKVPLMKSDDTWHYSLENALALLTESEEETTGLSYEDYMRIFLMLEDEDKVTLRAMDMVEADMRLTAGNEAFRLDGCVDCLEMTATVTSSFGYETTVTRQRGYMMQ